MSTTDYRGLLEEARLKFNEGDIDTYVDMLYAPNARLHFLPPELPPGREGARLYYGSFFASFSDVDLVFDDMVLQEDRLVIRFHIDMTHLGEFNGIPPTGKRVTLVGITGMRFVDGQVAERWTQADFLGFMQQFGVV